MRIAFLDCETTGLDLEAHEIWEVGIIVRELALQTDMTYIQVEEDVEHHWFLPMFNFNQADPFALDIGKFWDRYVWPDMSRYTSEGQYMAEWCRMWSQMTRGATIVGACVDFDVYRLDKLLKRYSYRMFHNYHLVDVENLVAGKLALPPPWKSADLYEAMNYKPVEEDKHTALGDCRAVRDVYDLVMGGRLD